MKPFNKHCSFYYNILIINQLPPRKLQQNCNSPNNSIFFTNYKFAIKLLTFFSYGKA